MSKTRLILSILVIPFGMFVFVFGGYDDSPGAQLLGVIFFVIGIISLVISRKKNS